MLTSFPQSQHSSKQLAGMLVSTRRFRRGGFTLIELLMVIAIMTVITTVLVLRQQQFDSSTLLRSLAYSVALSVRQAQTYGVSVKANSAGDFAKGYGVYFCTNATGSAYCGNSNYTLFSDNNDSGGHNDGEVAQTFSMGKGYTVTNFCAIYVDNTKDCLSGGTGATQTLQVLFHRPNPDACFATDANSNCSSTATVSPYLKACVQMTSSGGGVRSVVMTQAGEIYVNNTPC